MDRPIDIWGGGGGGVQQHVDSDIFVDRNKRDGKFWTR